MDNFNASLLKKFLTPKIIFIILGVVILIEIIFAIRSLTTSVSTTPPPIPQVTSKVSAGEISLTASKTKFSVGEKIPISVIVDSGGHSIAGVDLIVKFDPQALQASKTDINTGSILDDYPLASVDEKEGLVTISGISQNKDGKILSGQFALINFQAKKTGKTSIVVDFQRDTTTHTNLVEANTLENILEKVDNLELTIQ